MWRGGITRSVVRRRDVVRMRHVSATHHIDV